MLCHVLGRRGCDLQSLELKKGRRKRSAMIPEKPCKVMEPESISHLGWRNWGGNEGGYGVPGPGWVGGWIWGGYGLVGADPASFCLYEELSNAMQSSRASLYSAMLDVEQQTL